MRLARRRVVLAAGAVALALGGCDKPAGGGPGFKGIDITGAEYARKLALPDSQGKPRTLADFKGRVLVLFFGYTQCPDFCPTALAELAEARRGLGPDGTRVQVVFVSVDPERDTPALLSAYMANFGDDLVALRGSLEQTQAVAREFKVFFGKNPGKTEGSYTVDHTTGIYLFDARGRVRVVTRPGAGVQALMADLKVLLAEKG